MLEQCPREAKTVVRFHPSPPKFPFQIKVVCLVLTQKESERYVQREPYAEGNISKSTGLLYLTLIG